MPRSKKTNQLLNAPVPAEKAESAREAYSVPALDKAVEVLDLLASAAEGLTLAEIVSKTGRSMGELYRLVVALERHHLIARDQERERYSLSLRLFEMAHRHPPTERLLERAQPIMDELSRAIDQSCHLAVLQLPTVLVIAAAHSPLPMQYSVRVGSQFPVLEASSGIVLLAHAPSALVSGVLVGLAAGQRAVVQRRLESVRRTGREHVPSSVVSGIINLSTPIFDHRHRAIAALTVPYLGQRYARASVEAAEEALLSHAARLSGSLGAPPAPACAESSRA
jgi:DNA-binding IclR family transcriptional regulator